ncbi:MAG TPA: GTPase Era, partial [Spirochaetaceae bacterium]|nr:GTPase Era [Spirochaetaceae bacterium]
MKQVTVAIIGRPSSGKSTFVNTITENKVSIVSSVPQSTLSMVKGIYENSGMRFVFLDTPGLYDSDASFNKLLRKQSLNAIRECDCLLYVIDGKDKIKTEEEKVAFYARTSNKPIVILINKSDILGDEDVKRAKGFISKTLPGIDRIFIGSAKEDIGLDDVLKALSQYGKDAQIDPDGKSDSESSTADEFNDPITFTEASVEFRISEIIREAAFRNLMEEIPHAVCVICDDISESGGNVVIRATLYCEKESQKGIII